MKMQLFDEEDEEQVIREAANQIWKSMKIDGRPDSPNRCVICDTTKGLTSEGWYGYRCQSRGCMVL